MNLKNIDIDHVFQNIPHCNPRLLLVGLFSALMIFGCSGSGGGDNNGGGDESDSIDTEAHSSPSLASLPRMDIGSLIISTESGSLGNLIQDWSSSFGYSFSFERTLSEGVFLVRAFLAGTTDPISEDLTNTVASGIALMPGIRFAHPDFIFYRTAIPNDPYYALQWHYEQIRMPEAWDRTTGSSSVVVSILDTGILSNHPDIAGTLVSGYDFISSIISSMDSDGRDSDPEDPGDSFTDPSYHGTHVAGTINAATNNSLGVAGVGWQLKIQPVRVLGLMGATTSDLIDAVRWASGLPVEGVPENPNHGKVINMSLGAAETCEAMTGMQEAIDDATAQGVTVVVAAGNETSNAASYAPASCNNVITVAASNINGSLAYYSNFGSTVEIMAPGGDTRFDLNDDGYADGVLSTLKLEDGSYGYAYYQGTSMATPHVSGISALLLSVNPSLTPAQITDILEQTASPRTMEQCPPLRSCGAGLMDAAAALDQAAAM